MTRFSPERGGLVRLQASEQVGERAFAFAFGYDPRLAQAIRLMEGHVDRPLTTAAIAKRAGVTSRTLEAIFRRSIGETPGAYYLRLRLNAARKLVTDTRVPMADIAGRTGFSSAAAFSRAFSRAFGAAPVRLRRR